MRGADERQAILFSTRSIEDRIPAAHPLRALRTLVDPILVELSPRFQALYSAVGRPSIPPEQLLRALLLQVCYTIRSERQLMEQLDYNLLYRWFVGLTPDDPVWVPTVFSKNRDRLLEGNIADAFFNAVLGVADRHHLLSHDHFTVDGTLLEAWASQKSFRPKDHPEPPPPSDDDGPGYAGRNPSLNFRGQKRSNTTHQSVTDPDARLARKSHHTAAILAYQASVLTENRHGLIVQTDVRSPSGHAECDAGLTMLTCLPPSRRQRTLGADRGYDVPEFVAGVRRLRFTPHVSPNPKRYRGQQSAIDERTTRHGGYVISQRKRKLVEQGFGWQKSVGVLRKLHHRGCEVVGWLFAFTSAAYNLIRLRSLLAGAPA
ncbi:MAG TPA: IS5 family transposase [Candidatus Binataceae bacterium]|nr:IS5 family transposase [Candidatus Binataceae bacterium]